MSSARRAGIFSPSSLEGVAPPLDEAAGDACAEVEELSGEEGDASLEI